MRAGGWEAVLFAGWSRAAIASAGSDQEAGAWMVALVSRALGAAGPGTRRDAGVVGRLARQRRPGPGRARGPALPSLPPDAPAVLDDAIRVLRFRYEMLKELDDDDGAG